MNTRGETARKGFSAAYFTLFAIQGVTVPWLQVLLAGLGYGPGAIGLFLAWFELVGIFGPIEIARRADGSGRCRGALAWAAIAILAALPLLAWVAHPLATAVAVSLLAIGIKAQMPLLDGGALAFLTAAAIREGRPRWGGYGALRVMGSLGFIAAALATQAIPGFDHSPPWAIAAAIAVPTGAFMVTLGWLPAATEQASPAHGAAERGEQGGKLLNGKLALGFAVIALGRLAMAPLNSFVSLYATEALHVHSVGALWAVATLSEVPFMIVAGRIVARTGAMAAVAISSLALVARLGLCALVPSVGGLVIAQLFNSLTWGLFFPAAVAFVNETVPPRQRNTGLALFMGVAVGLPSFVGNALAGFVVEAAGYRVLWGSFALFAASSVALWAVCRRRFER